MIPPFDARGALPPTPDRSPYRAGSLREVEQRFVDDFGSPPWRRALIDGLELLTVSVKHAAPTARWWIWGSLLTVRTAPLFGDREALDAAIIVPADGLEPASVSLLMATRSSALELHMVDIHEVVFEFSPLDGRRPITDAVLSKVRSRASRTIVDDRDRVQIDSGFVEVLP